MTGRSCGTHVKRRKWTGAGSARAGVRHSILVLTSMRMKSLDIPGREFRMYIHAHEPRAKYASKIVILQNRLPTQSSVLGPGSPAKYISPSPYTFVADCIYLYPSKGKG